MKMLLQLSWRNIWRHPARSGVLLAAIIAGLWAGIAATGIMNGFVDQRLVNLVEEELTHVQVHHPEFLSEREPHMLLEQTGEISIFLDDDPRIRSWAFRVLADGMVQSPITTSGVQIRGVDPVRERNTTIFYRHVQEGDYLNDDIRNPLLMGRQLSEKLNLELGDRVVLTFQDINNEITSASFNITGIFRSGSNQYDERTVFVRADNLQELIAGEPVWHEAAILLHHADDSGELASALNESFPGMIAETWYELSPELRIMSLMGENVLFYIMLIIMLALVFGILNTMLMAIFERMRELGMLMAVGMGRARIFTMIMMEAVTLSLAGAIGGMLLGWLTMIYFGSNGIDLTLLDAALSEFGYQSLIYPYIHTADYITITLMVTTTAILAAIYPAIKALRLRPAEVVRN